MGSQGDDEAAIDRAARIIRANGLVAFPTETVYGLGANALSAEAVGKIYQAKRRSPEDPCIVHIARAEDLAQVAVLPPASTPAATWVSMLAAAYWPGPLSLILPRAAAIPELVTAGRPTVAVRIPRHPVALALIRAAGVPIAAPSANTFMHTSPTTAHHVWNDLAGQIDLILDGGETQVGVESTVLDLSHDVPTVLRPGGVSLEQLRSVLGPVVAGSPRNAKLTDTDREMGLHAPGMLEKHYAPHAEVVLLDGPTSEVRPDLAQRAHALLTSGTRVGALVTDEDAQALEDMGPPELVIARLGSQHDLVAIARRLYAALRDLEDIGVEVILARLIHGEDLGQAIRDRLLRAAGGRLIPVDGSPKKPFSPC